MRKMKQVQRKATKWITNGAADYKERLLRLKILPLSMYMEVHDILYLISVVEGNYEAKNMPVTKSRGRLTRQQTELYIPQQRLKKCDENFWIRAPKLLNLVQRSLFANEIINKKESPNYTTHSSVTDSTRLTLTRGECYAHVETVIP